MRDLKQHDELLGTAWSPDEIHLPVWWRTILRPRVLFKLSKVNNIKIKTFFLTLPFVLIKAWKVDSFFWNKSQIHLKEFVYTATTCPHTRTYTNLQLDGFLCLIRSDHLRAYYHPCPKGVTAEQLGLRALGSMDCSQNMGSSIALGSASTFWLQ